jgi:predicted cupin superfamily sugar epimerase
MRHTPIDADALIEELGLAPHPEGGWFAETWRDEPEDGGRGSGTAIYFLLRAGEASHWHRVDATEIWHHHAGGALLLSIATADEGPVTEVVLGADLAGGQRPQGIVPAGAWQAARPVDDDVLVGCTVSPAFTFDAFELAPPGWSPGRG